VASSGDGLHIEKVVRGSSRIRFVLGEEAEHDLASYSVEALNFATEIEIVLCAADRAVAKFPVVVGVSQPKGRELMEVGVFIGRHVGWTCDEEVDVLGRI